jgi:hypothetical protein
MYPTEPSGKTCRPTAAWAKEVMGAVIAEMNKSDGMMKYVTQI